MLPPYDKLLRFKLSAVRTYQVWLLVFYVSASLLLIFYTSLPLSLKVTLLLVLLAMLFWQWQKLMRLPRVLIKQSDMDWVLEDQQGNSMAAILNDHAYVSSWLIILHFNLSDSKNISLVILPYMLDRNSFRQLSVYLRMTNLKMLTDE